jgi:glutamate carboxypeptidase
MSLRQISAAVHERRSEMLELLEEVVNLESPSEDKALADRVGDVFQARGEQLGLRFERDPQTEYGDNRVGKLSSSAKGPRILLVGHYDTVYPAGTAWPFRTEGNLGYGPGAFDMKGGLLIGLYAIEAVRAAVDGWDLPITFIFNSDEEPGSPRSR